MSGAIGDAGDASLRSLLIANATTAKHNIATLSAQSASGKISQSYSGLAPGAAKVALDLSGAIAQQDAVVSGINDATGSLGVAQNALKQIASVASELKSKLSGINPADPASLDSLGAWARDSLRQVAGLIDATEGGKYVFGGTDSANPPLPDPQNIGSSGFVAAITSAVSGLGTDNAKATTTLAAVRAASTDDSVSPFSPFLTAAAAAGTDLRTTIETGDGGPSGTRVPAGIVANANGDAKSDPTKGSSGSYIKDILASLAATGALGASHANDTGLVAFALGTLSTLNDAIAAQSVDAGALGDRQALLTAHAAELGSSKIALQRHVSNIEDADLATTATQLSAAQTQLEASYRLIAGLNSLSLVNFL